MYFSLYSTDVLTLFKGTSNSGHLPLYDQLMPRNKKNVAQIRKAAKWICIPKLLIHTPILNQQMAKPS